MACLGFTALPVRGDGIILHLKNGDRISGKVTSETANEIVVSTSFAGTITIPLQEVARREPLLPPPADPTHPAPPQAPTPPTTPPQPSAPRPEDKPAAAAPAAAPVEAPAPSWMKEFLSEWKGDAQVGINIGFSTRTHQTYTARLKAVYSPTKTLRNNLDYLASYGTTDGVLSENQMDGSWKLEYDIGRTKRFLIYNALGAGYNDIQKIDFRYDLGPGVGYKWLVLTNFVLKTEFGGNYQEQFYSTGDKKSRYSLRLAEDMTWQITSRLKFENRFEFFPEVDDFTDYRIRAEGNLSYLLRSNLTLTLSVIDRYDTSPARGATQNELQIRSLIGVKF